ncbi:hypothetical protein QE152_g35094 [Popillia japonica]|uniref:Uncharacterized protein n=1 Tax=Popillia japonica TaxID=7064 RepID=A0AAW1IRE8_POPJA
MGAVENVVNTHVKLPEVAKSSIKRKKRLKVAAGKSISADDLLREPDTVEPQMNNADLGEEDDLEEEKFLHIFFRVEVKKGKSTEIASVQGSAKRKIIDLSLLEKGNFVVARFTYDEGTKKETSKLYVSEILKCNKQTYDVSCLRPLVRNNDTFLNVGKHYNKIVFIYPNVLDNNKIKKEQIVKVLPEPSIKRGKYFFNVNLDFMNIK